MNQGAISSQSVYCTAMAQKRIDGIFALREGTAPFLQDVEATLLPWDAPPTASSAEVSEVSCIIVRRTSTLTAQAYQDWESSAKPSGWRLSLAP